MLDSHLVAHMSQCSEGDSDNNQGSSTQTKDKKRRGARLYGAYAYPQTETSFRNCSYPFSSSLLLLGR